MNVRTYVYAQPNIYICIYVRMHMLIHTDDDDDDNDEGRSRLSPSQPTYVRTYVRTNAPPAPAPSCRGVSVRVSVGVRWVSVGVHS